MSTSVKFFHSGMPGALNAVSGSTTGTSTGPQSFLRQCLVTGFNSRTATSLTVASGVATMGLPSGHGFEVDCVVLVAGATPTALNGEKRVTAVGANTLTFAAAGVPDGAATGTITAMFAPAGWEEPISGGDSLDGSVATGARIFRSLDPTATGRYFRAGGGLGSLVSAQISGFETATGIWTGLGGWGASLIHCWGTAAGAVSSPWLVIADSKTVYLLMGGPPTNGTTNGGTCFGFGDFKSFATADSHNAFLGGPTSSTFALADLTTVTGRPLGYISNDNTNAFVSLNRGYSGAPGSVNAIVTGESYFGGAAAANTGALATAAAQAYPNTPNNSLLLSRVMLSETGAGVRGHLRGFYVSPHNHHASFTQQARIVGQGAFAGRKLMAIKPGPRSTATSFGVAFIDIIGPWE